MRISNIEDAFLLVECNDVRFAADASFLQKVDFSKWTLSDFEFLMSEISVHKLAHLREQDTDCGLRSCIVCRTTFRGRGLKLILQNPGKCP